MVDFSREITHTKYKYEKQLKKYYHRVEKRLHIFPNELNGNENDKWVYIYFKINLNHEESI